MPWTPLEEAPKDYAGEKKKTRFLVDESLGVEIAEYIRGRGFNALFVADAGLRGRSDEDVFAVAWRERRVLLTHDRDFLDDGRFPENRNPGVIVLPGGNGERYAMGRGIRTALTVFGGSPSVWERMKTVISPTGEMAIRRRHSETGTIKTTRYRLTRKGYAEIWVD
jgi:predicted nuclease of predicted toxin-antitoxin system